MAGKLLTMVGIRRSCTEGSAKALGERGHGMRVMFEVTARRHTMTKGKDRRRLGDVKAVLGEDGDFLRPLVEMVVQELLEAEMSAALGAEKGERTPERVG
jgi:hypothetical protein